MAQQTAMQQAISHYEKLSERGSDQAWLIAEYLKENYLELEKEQIINAATWGELAETGEQYYNETYKNK